MVISINIDETIRRPNVRPPNPASKRGPITFIAEIEEPNGRDIYRNLSRGVNAIDDGAIPSPPLPQQPVDIALANLILSLSVLSDFAFPVQVPLSSVVVDLTLPDIQVLTAGELDLSTISVELTNLAGINNGLAIADVESLSLTLPDPVFVTPVDVLLSSVVVDLTVPEVEVVATGSQRRDLGNLIVDLTSQAAVTVVQDSDVSATFTAEIEVTTGFTAEADPVELSIEGPELNTESKLIVTGKQ